MKFAAAVLTLLGFVAVSQASPYFHGPPRRYGCGFRPGGYPNIYPVPVPVPQLQGNNQLAALQSLLGTLPSGNNQGGLVQSLLRLLGLNTSANQQAQTPSLAQLQSLLNSLVSQTASASAATPPPGLTLAQLQNLLSSLSG